MPILPVRHCLDLLKVKKKNLWTYIQTCQKIKTSFMQGVALVTALRGEIAAQVIQGMRKKINPNENDSTNKNCFFCGQMGHFCWQCPAKQRQQAVPIQTKTNPPKTPCPRCQKRYHWAKDCWSKFHKDETTLTPQIQKVIFLSFRETGNRDSPGPKQQ